MHFHFNYLLFMYVYFTCDVGAVFYVVSKKSDFYKKFKAGLWAPPS